MSTSFQVKSLFNLLPLFSLSSVLTSSVIILTPFKDSPNFGNGTDPIATVKLYDLFDGDSDSGDPNKIMFGLFVSAFIFACFVAQPLMFFGENKFRKMFFVGQFASSTISTFLLLAGSIILTCNYDPEVWSYGAYTSWPAFSFSLLTWLLLFLYVSQDNFLQYNFTWEELLQPFEARFLSHWLPTAVSVLLIAALGYPSDGLDYNNSTHLMQFTTIWITLFALLAHLVFVNTTVDIGHGNEKDTAGKNNFAAFCMTMTLLFVPSLVFVVNYGMEGSDESQTYLSALQYVMMFIIFILSSLVTLFVFVIPVLIVLFHSLTLGYVQKWVESIWGDVENIW